MKKILITGFSGFVASHFIKYLYNANLLYDIYGIDVVYPPFDYNIFSDKLNISFRIINMVNIKQLNEVIVFFKPDYVLHLASFSSVAYSWQNPSDSFINNSSIFLNLVTVIKNTNIKCRILSVGSSEEYGDIAYEDIPIRETKCIDPRSPYAVARVSQEMLSKVFVDAYDMNIVMTRSFNHIGPGQDERFVVPSFIKRILKIRNAGKCEGKIEVGDLRIVRDFVDVRDVVKAYYKLLIGAKNGEIYNVCSGKGISLQTIMDMVADIVGVKVQSILNTDYIRPNENMVIIGSNSKIVSELDWRPMIPITETVSDMINYYNNDYVMEE